MTCSECGAETDHQVYLKAQYASLGPFSPGLGKFLCICRDCYENPILWRHCQEQALRDLPPCDEAQ